MKINSLFILKELENIKTTNKKNISENELIKEIKKNPKIINYFKVWNLTPNIVNELFKIETNDLFNNILIKDSCLYNHLLKIYFVKFKKLPNNITLTQDIVNEIALSDPNFIRYLINLNSYYHKYLTEFILQVLIVYGKDFRLTEIPEKLLTEDLILLALSKSDSALTKLGELKRTDLMKETSKKHKQGDKTLYNDLYNKLEVIKQTIKDQENLEIQRNQMPKLISMIKDYYKYPYISIKTHCKKQKISEKIFEYGNETISKYNNELNNNANNHYNIHNKELDDQIINLIEDNIENGIKSPEKQNIIAFNATLYYLYYNIDIDDLMSKEILTKKIRLRNKIINIIKRPTNSYGIELFHNDHISFNGEEITQETKFKIEEFMIRHNIPLKHTLARQVLNLYRNNDIDINKNYKDKISFERNETNIDDLFNKIEIIKTQENIINLIDNKINNLKQERKELILKW